MRLSVTIRSTIALACVGVELVASIAVKAPGNTARDASPSFPYDPNTTRYCTDWWDTLGLFSCQELVDIYSLNTADFVRWNPSITAACGNFIESGHSYCVRADGEPVVTTTAPPTTVPPTKTTAGPTSTPTTSTPTTGPPPTTTVVDGTAYPIPPAPTILGSTPTFKKWYVIEGGDTCLAIAAKFDVTKTQVNLWNTTSTWAAPIFGPPMPSEFLAHWQRNTGL